MRMRRNRTAVAALALLSATTAGTAGLAADLPPRSAEPVPPPAVEQWRFSASAYGWAAGLSGNVRQFNMPTIHMSQSFGDILKDLDFAGMLYGEARHGRFSVLADVMYTKISSGSGTPRGVIANRVDVTSQSFTGFLGAGYAIVDTPRTRIDLVAGLRVWNADTEISFSGGALAGVSASDSATWVNGLAGVRARHFLTDSVFLSGWGLVGAGQAKLDWDIGATIGYRFNQHVSAVAGYRALGVDYRRGGFVYDVVQHGPITGLVVHF